MNTSDILQIFKQKYADNDFRLIKNEAQQSKTIEIQGAHFIVDKPWIVREPNYEYFKRELQWYDSQSLNICDIPQPIPSTWSRVADKQGFITSNYGWCIYSEENNNQYVYCLNKLLDDPHTREATMIYTRPSMVKDGFDNGMHDFMCTFAVQCFLNDVDDDTQKLDYHVYMRSNDAVFGFNNDALWHMTVQQRLVDDLNVINYHMTAEDDKKITVGDLIWNAGSLHVYEKHFKYLY